MRTDDLIRAIALDGAAPRPSLVRRMAAALAVGGVVAVVIFAVRLGVRPDLGTALQTWRFLFKLAITLLWGALAFRACVRLARPEAGMRDALLALAAVPGLLALAVGFELLAVAPAEWPARALGTNARVCLVAVPVLSMAPLAVLLAALRSGAPRSPAMAGAVGGLLAASLAAALYATHCPDDSPLFVAAWYSIAVALVVLLGGLAGHRVLRW